MRICLINPPIIVPRAVGIPFVFQPLGLLYVAAALEKDHEIHVLDAAVEDWQNLTKVDGNYYMGLSFVEIRRRIEELKPDVVGISAQFSINEQSALRAAFEVKSANRNIVTVMGGPHATVRPIETLSSPNVDIVVVGEGEITMQELLDKMSLGTLTALGDVPGIGYKKDGVPVLTSPRPLIEDLDSLAFPARHLAPMDKYFEAMSAKRGARELYTFDKMWTSIFTSRGCTYNCNFCSIHLTMGRKFRKRSPENVIEEIKDIVHKYDIRHINFEDDNLTLDKKRADRIFDLMVQKDVDLTWSTPNGVRVENIDEEMVRKMKASGCRRVFVAPESGVQRVVSEVIGKNLDLKKIDDAVSLFKKHGIIVDGSFVIGLIGETKKDIWNTIRYIFSLKRLGLSEVGLHIATPYYGTRLYQEAKQKGFLRKKFKSSLLYTGEPLIETSDWSAFSLLRIKWIAGFLVASGVKAKIIYVLWSVPLLRKPLQFVKNIVLAIWNALKGLAKSIKSFLRLLGVTSKNFLLKTGRKLSIPELIVFEVTDACNSRCKHCFIWKQKPTKPVITPAEVKRVLSDNFFSKLQVVLLTGGEAVLRQDIDDLIRAIHEARPKAEISLSTNGLLPDGVIATVTRASESGIRLNVGVSLDAVGERHDQIRGVKGNFAKVDYLLKKLVRLKNRNQDKLGSIVVGHTLSNLTWNTVEEVKKYADRLGVGFVTQLHEKFSYYYNLNEHGGDAENYRKTDNREIVETIRRLPATFHNAVLLSAAQHKLRYKCSSLRTFFLLKCDGSVSPCLQFSNTIVGNVRSTPATEIWRSKAACSARKMVSACRGCSNTWATDWSATYWPFSFWKEFTALLAAKLSGR